MGLDSLAHLHLSGVTHHLVLAHKGETVADGGGLAKANRPPDCVLLKGRKVAFDHWYHPVQARLQITCTGQCNASWAAVGCKAEDHGGWRI